MLLEEKDLLWYPSVEHLKNRLVKSSVRECSSSRNAIAITSLRLFTLEEFVNRYKSLIHIMFLRALYVVINSSDDCI